MRYLDVYKFWNDLDTEHDVVTANGMASITAHQALKVKKGQRLITNAGLGQMGSGLPLAIGACVASKKPIICATGDGSIMLNIQELQTIRHHNLPIKIFIFNNKVYGAILEYQDSELGKRYEASDKNHGYSHPDFAKISSAFGLPYYRIASHEDLDVIDTVLGKDGPVICELSIDQKFRVYKPEQEPDMPLGETSPEDKISLF